MYKKQTKHRLGYIVEIGTGPEEGGGQSVVSIAPAVMYQRKQIGWSNKPVYHLLQTSLYLESHLMVQLIGVNTLKCNATKIDRCYRLQSLFIKLCLLSQCVVLCTHCCKGTVLQVKWGIGLPNAQPPRMNNFWSELAYYTNIGYTKLFSFIW